MLLHLCPLKVENKEAVQRSSFLLLSYLGCVQGTEGSELKQSLQSKSFAPLLSSICLPFSILYISGLSNLAVHVR